MLLYDLLLFLKNLFKSKARLKLVDICHLIFSIVMRYLPWTPGQWRQKWLVDRGIHLWYSAGHYGQKLAEN